MQELATRQQSAAGVNASLLQELVKWQQSAANRSPVLQTSSSDTAASAMRRYRVSQGAATLEGQGTDGTATLPLFTGIAGPRAFTA